MSERGQRERVRKFSTKYRGRSRSVGRRMMEQAEDEGKQQKNNSQKTNTFFRSETIQTMAKGKCIRILCGIWS